MPFAQITTKYKARNADKQIYGILEKKIPDALESIGRRRNDPESLLFGTNEIARVDAYVLFEMGDVNEAHQAALDEQRVVAQFTVCGNNRVYTVGSTYQFSDEEIHHIERTYPGLVAVNTGMLSTNNVELNKVTEDRNRIATELKTAQEVLEKNARDLAAAQNETKSQAEINAKLQRELEETKAALAGLRDKAEPAPKKKSGRSSAS